MQLGSRGVSSASSGLEWDRGTGLIRRDPRLGKRCARHLKWATLSGGYPEVLQHSELEPVRDQKICHAQLSDTRKDREVWGLFKMPEHPWASPPDVHIWRKIFIHLNHRSSQKICDQPSIMAITPTTHKVPALILGTANWGENATISSPEQAQLFLDILKRHNLRTIDTSRNYPAEGVFGTSEVLIGKVKAASQGFLIDSKVDNFTPGDLKYNNILASVEKELSALQADRVRVQYLHWPDRTVPLTETLQAMNEAYKQGKFDKFGISNYSVAEIEEIMEICEREDWIKPSVYQGHYNVLCRRGEKQLFPSLRKHGFSFYAWSPAAAGMASKNASMIDRKVSLAHLISEAVY